MSTCLRGPNPLPPAPAATVASLVGANSTASASEAEHERTPDDLTGDLRVRRENEFAASSSGSAEDLVCWATARALMGAK